MNDFVLEEFDYSGADAGGWRTATQKLTTKCPECGNKVEWTSCYSIKAPSWQELLKADIKNWWIDFKRRFLREDR